MESMVVEFKIDWARAIEDAAIEYADAYTELQCDADNDHQREHREALKNLRETIKRGLEVAAAPQPAAQPSTEARGVMDIHAAFWAMRSKILKIPRYSFLLNSGGGVSKVADRYGKWIEVDSAAGLCEVESVDTILAESTPAQTVRQPMTPQQIVEMHAKVAPFAKTLSCEVIAVIAGVESFHGIKDGPQPAAKPEPVPTSVSKSKRTHLEADGYVVNGVALMHPETRQRVLLDYCGFIGWWHGQVHHDQQAQAQEHAQPERKPMTRDEIRAEWDKFIEYPSESRLHVTTTSALLFAERIAQKCIKDTP